MEKKLRIFFFSLEKILIHILFAKGKNTSKCLLSRDFDDIGLFAESVATRCCQSLLTSWRVQALILEVVEMLCITMFMLLIFSLDRQVRPVNKPPGYSDGGSSALIYYQCIRREQGGINTHPSVTHNEISFFYCISALPHQAINVIRLCLIYAYCYASVQCYSLFTLLVK